MTFEFDGNCEDYYKTLTGLIKGNQGLFKSIKQSNFLVKRFREEMCAFDAPASVKQYFGIDMSEDQIAVSINATTRWADYGTRSIRPVTWIFVIDKYGIVAEYKLGYTGDMRSGTSPDPLKTKQLWVRTAPVKEFDEPVVASPGEHIGTIGQRMQVTGKIVRIGTYSKPRFHYYDSDVGYVTTIKVGNDMLIYWGALRDKQEGDVITLKFTVKEHANRNGINQTVISRPSLLVQKELELT